MAAATVMWQRVVVASGGGEVSGVVADGYLRGATVCLDVNGNKKCDLLANGGDIDEPRATSSTGGVYTLAAGELAKLPAETSASDYPVLVEIKAGETVDEDTIDPVNNPTGTPIAKDYVLSAPAGEHAFVSPLTTLVQNQIESNPTLSVEEAETLVKSQIGVTVSLFEDYVQPAVGGLSPEAAQAREDEMARLHRVAQVVATAMAEMQADVEGTVGDDVDLKIIVKVVVDEVMDQLQAIVVAVDEVADEDDFDPLTVTEQVGSIDPDTIEAKIEEKGTPIARSSFAAMLEGDGSFWLEHFQDGGESQFEYGNIKLPTGEDTPVETLYVWENGAWQQDDEDEIDYLLTANGWQEFSDTADNYTVHFDADGTALMTHTTTGYKERLSAVELDLSGKSHKAIAGLMDKLLVDNTATFPAGSKGYRLTYVPQQEVYSIETWLDDNGDDGTFVRYWDQGLGQKLPVTSLQQARTVFAQGASYLSLDGRDGANLAVQLGADGTLYCYEQPWNWNNPVELLNQTGRWSEVQVFGVPLIKLVVPDQFLARFDFDGQPFLVVKDGVVKRGDYLAAGMVDVDEELNFNTAAFESLRGNIDFNYIPEQDPDGPGDGGNFVDPPAVEQIVDFVREDLSGKSYLVREGDELTFMTFHADNTFAYLELFFDNDQEFIEEGSGDWDINEYGQLVQQFSGDAPTAVTLARKLEDSNNNSVHVYWEDSEEGQPVMSGYLHMETAVAFNDPGGLTLVGEDGVTISFQVNGSGSISDTLDNSNDQFDWTLANGIITLNLSDGSSITLYLLGNGSSGNTLAIFGVDREANGDVIDIFHDVMTVVQ